MLMLLTTSVCKEKKRIKHTKRHKNVRAYVINTLVIEHLFDHAHGHFLLDRQKLNT